MLIVGGDGVDLVIVWVVFDFVLCIGEVLLLIGVLVLDVMVLVL